MNAYPDDHCPEGKMVITTNFELLQVVVVQDTVIHTFAGRTFIVNGFVLFTVPWNTWMKPKIGTILYIDCPSITALFTLRREGALLNPAACKGTAEFLRILVFVISPAAHAQSGPA